MCDEDISIGLSAGALSRREALLGAAALSLVSCEATEPMTPEGASLIERRHVEIPTPDGMLDAVVLRSEEDQRAILLLWPDIAGLRPAFEVMAERFARQTFTVVLLNSYYRDVPWGRFADFAGFVSDEGFTQSRAWREKLTADAIGRDAKAIERWLDSANLTGDGVPFLTQGYCLGGAHALWTAKTLGDRVYAAVSFHGASLIADTTDSPHTALLSERTKFFLAISRDDDLSQPEDKRILSSLSAVARVYTADHGWTVLDAPAYEVGEAEKAFADTLIFYQEALG